MHGEGVMTYNDKSEYKGTFKKGLRNGQGKMIYHDGSVYVGLWEND